MTPARSRAARLGGLALVCYVPLLLTARGQVAADTKTYLYLDPGRLLARAPYLWDEHVAFGTVTHQNVGYLWPMGPWYWLFDRLGSPDWVAQRLWMGTLLLLAGAGILYLGRTLGPPSPAAWTAGAFAYALTPYVLDYVSRISVLLLPWAALPWLVAIAHRALLSGRWRHAAVFALVVASAGGVNATALVLAGIGPVLWIVFAVAVHGEATWRRAVATVLRIGVLTLLTNAWWIAGLVVQGGWGLDVLRYTETVETVARSSLSSEVLRGLGYWFFYGTDKLGPWIEPGRTYTGEAWLIAVGFVLPVLALTAAWLVRWRYRAFAVSLVILGTAIAVGAFPYRSPSPIGALFKRFATSSTAGLALRSTGRAIPLLVLGLVLLLVAGIVAVGRRRAGFGTAAAVAVVLLALLGNPSLWDGGFVAGNLRHPEEVPAYWAEAAAHLDARGDDTRVLEIPGSDFATYRWGNRVEPVTPGLMDRPFAARELVPYGTEASADLLIALDRRIQEGVLDPDALAPLAGLLAVGDVVVRSDLEYERFRVARPSQVWDMLRPALGSWGRPVRFGRPSENRATPSLPMRDEIYLQTRDAAVTEPVVVLPAKETMPIVRTRSASGAVVLEGDGEGVVESAAAGLLGGRGALLSAPGLAGRPELLRRALDDGARLVVTDTNRQRARRWGTVRDNDGYTERPGETPLVDDPSDNRLPLFPDAPASAYTTVEQRGVARVEASRYGNPVTFTPADRPANAVDGEPGTAWVVGGLGPVGGSRLLIEAEEPVRTDHVDLLQARLGDRTITRVGVRLDGDEILSADLDDRSFEGRGQRIDLGEARSFRTLELVIERDSVGRLPNYAQQNGVGFAEVGVGDLRVDEVVQLPQHLLDQADDAPLTILLSRLRASASEPFARDEEPVLKRTFRLPAARSFIVGGQARLDDTRADEDVDALLGGAVSASSGRLPGDPANRGAAAFDGDPDTAWVGRFGDERGMWVDVRRAAPVTITELRPTFLDDGDHSVPTRMTITAESGERRTVDLAGGPVRIEPLTAAVFRFTVDEVRPATTIDWFSEAPITMPVGIVDIGVPALEAPLPDGRLSLCRDDLLEVDGRPVPLLVTGDAGAPLTVATCDGAPLPLAAGAHEVRARGGWLTGFDLDRLVLSSEQPGAVLPGDTGRVEVLDHGPVSYDLRVTGDGPTWVVLGQSLSPGWKATLDGEDLGEPVLVDGFANGWLVEGPGIVQLRWTPQRIVWGGLGISAFGLLLCLGVLLGALWSKDRRIGGLLTTNVAPGPLLRLRPLEAGPAPSLGRSLLLAAAVGVAAGLAVHPLVGVVVAVVAAVGLRAPFGRAVGLAAPALVALAGLYTAVKQLRNDYPADFGWTDFFHPAHYLAWTGLALLVTLLVVDRERRR